MPYRQVSFSPDHFYHLYNRGVGKRELFKENRDYWRFLERTKEYSLEKKVDINCFCLMPNHFHFLVCQKEEKPIFEFMQKLGVSYAMYFNLKYQNVGPIFQGRFKAKLIEKEEYLLHLSRYIHQNSWELVAIEKRTSPKFRSFLRNYQWSSYQYYLDLRAKSWIETKAISSYFSKTNPNFSYRDFVESPLFAGEIEKLKGVLIDV